MPRPTVTIGFPVFNGAQFLEESVRSLLSQDFEDIEVIISDNASTDATRDLAEQLTTEDSRVRYVRLDQNVGAAANYNRLVDAARGAFFKWQAHDDVCLPGFLRACLAPFSNRPDSPVLVYPRTQVIDADGLALGQFLTESIDSPAPSPHARLEVVLRQLNMACAIFGLIRHEVLRKTRRIGPFPASDYVLLAELAMLGHVHEVPQVLFQRRVHPGISTYANRSRDDIQQWFDPSRPPPPRFVSPMLWLGREFMRSISTLPLNSAERVKCRWTVARTWYPRELRNLGGRWKAHLKQAIGVEPHDSTSIHT